MPQTSSHLLIAWAASAAPGCQQALRELALPQLQRLLARLRARQDGAAAADETSLSPPHERALAQALGLPCADGRIPWAAWQRQQQGRAADGQAWAFVTPCQWQVGADHVTLRDPDELALDEAATRALLAVVAPWFAADGIELHYDQPGRWIGCGAPFADLACAALERALLRDLRRWLPDPRQARTLLRLHSEVQMLLHTHPLNAAREQRGQAPVNAFWLHGAGRLPAASANTADTASAASAASAATVAQPTLLDSLSGPALHGDWQSWAREWRALDAGPLADLLRQARRGQSVRLTLCGERRALSLHGPQPTLALRLHSLVRPLRWKTLWKQL